MSPGRHTCDDAWGVPAPGAADILVTRVMLHGLCGGVYRRFVDGMSLRGDERVLDYGSGSGAAARHIAKRLRAGGGRLTCTDISPRWQRALRRTLRRYQNVEYALGDVRELGLPEGSFDVVLVHWMLHDVPVADRPSVLAVLARLLRPGGRLFIREPAGPGEGAAAAVRSLLSGAGLSELRGVESSAFFLGPNYSGVWGRSED